jgi:hypothetical protein
MDQDILDFGRLMSQPHFTPKKLDISSKKINYWKTEVVLPFFRKQKHTKLTIIEAAWLLVLKELSEIGITTEQLKQLSRDVWDKPRKEKYADRFLEEHINDRRSPLSPESKKRLKDVLKDELLMRTLRTEINPFTVMLKSSLLDSREPHSFIYSPNGGGHTTLLHSPEMFLKLSSKFTERSIINIPMRPILSRLVTMDMEHVDSDLAYLNGLEKQIRDIVVFKRPKAVEIVHEDNRIRPITITEQHKSREELARYILENKIANGSKLVMEIRPQGNYKLTLISK